MNDEQVILCPIKLDQSTTVRICTPKMLTCINTTKITRNNNLYRGMKHSMFSWYLKQPPINTLVYYVNYFNDFWKILFKKLREYSAICTIKITKSGDLLTFRADGYVPYYVYNTIPILNFAIIIKKYSTNFSIFYCKFK